MSARRQGKYAVDDAQIMEEYKADVLKRRAALKERIKRELRAETLSEKNARSIDLQQGNRTMPPRQHIPAQQQVRPRTSPITSRTSHKRPRSDSTIKQTQFSIESFLFSIKAMPEPAKFYAGGQIQPVLSHNLDEVPPTTPKLANSAQLEEMPPVTPLVETEEDSAAEATVEAPAEAEVVAGAVVTTEIATKEDHVLKPVIVETPRKKSTDRKDSVEHAEHRKATPKKAIRTTARKSGPILGSSEMVTALFKRIDTDKDGVITYSEFSRYVGFAMKNDTDPFENDLDNVFQSKIYKNYRKIGSSLATNEIYVNFDEEGDMLINKKEFRAGLMNFGVLMYNFDSNGTKYMFSPRSLGIFSATNPLRKAIVRLITWRWFDNFILLLIVANSLVLALEDYSDPGVERWKPAKLDPNLRNTLVEESELIFTVAFGCESLLKSLAMGFIVHQGAYLKDPWNVLDFVVAASGFVSVLPGVPTLSSLRTFRVLRPLRSLSTLPGMRALVTALLTSIPALANVSVLLFFVFMIFGIFGTQLFSGVLYFHCKATELPTYNVTAPFVWEMAEASICTQSSMTQSLGGYKCPADMYCGSSYEPPVDKCKAASPSFDCSLKNMNNGALPAADFNFGYTNFNSIGFAIITIFQCLTEEGWSPIMYMLMNATGDWVPIYFILLIITGSFFLMNLIFAVIWNEFSAFQQQEEAQKEAGIKESEEPTTEIFIQFAKEHKIKTHLHRGVKKGNVAPMPQENLAEMELQKRLAKKTSFKKVQEKEQEQEQEQEDVPDTALARFVMGNLFGSFIMSCIIINTVFLSLDKYPESADLNDVLKIANYILTAIFTIEMCIKLLALGFKRYCADSFNVFDGVIVIVSLFELVGEFAGFEANSAMSALRTFRLFRVFKLARSWESLNQVIHTVAGTLRQSGNFTLLLMLVIYIFSLIGMQFFAMRFHFHPETGEYVPWRPNELQYTWNGTKLLHVPVDERAGPAYVDYPWVQAWGTENAYINARTNFDNILNAFLAVFQVLSGEDWNAVMYDGVRAGGYGAIGYFVALVVIGNLIVLNLFLAILLDNSTQDVNDDAIEAAKKKEEEERIAKQKLFNTDEYLSNSGTRSPGSTPKSGSSAAEQSAIEEKREKEDKDTAAAAKLAQQVIVVNGKEIRLKCKRSLFCFGRKSGFRQQCALLATDSRFENLILFLIFVSSIALTIDNPLLDPDSETVKVLTYLNSVLVWTFVGEMLLRIVYLGFRDYIIDGWNQLDFFIVCISLITFFLNTEGLSFLRALRALRGLRPLRMLSRLPNLKRVVNTMIMSIPPASSVISVCLLFFLIFGIIGTNFFKGRFQFCEGLSETQWVEVDMEYGISSPDIFRRYFRQSNCEAMGGTWTNSHNNFDNVGEAMILLFETSTTEGWVDVMTRAIDSTGIDTQPVIYFSPYRSLFFVAFIIIGSFFALNLFVGAVIDAFQTMKASGDGAEFMTPAQREWLQTQMMMNKVNLKKQLKLPSDPIRAEIFKLVKNERFENFIMTCIGLNTVVMAAYSYGQSDAKADFIETANLVFALIFLAEAVLKIVALRMAYFKDSWNVFDLVIVFACTATYVCKWFFNLQLGGLASAARAFRMLLVFRVMKSLSNMQQLIDTVLQNLPAMCNISMVLALLLFVYAIMGVQLFATVQTVNQEELNMRANFQTFQNSFLTLFRCTTGEAWNSMMYELLVEPDTTMPLLGQAGSCVGTGADRQCMNNTESSGSCIKNPTYDHQENARKFYDSDWATVGCTPGYWLTMLYFGSFVILASFVMLNLFVAVILEGFEDKMEDVDKSLGEDDFKVFVEIWQKYDLEATYYITANKLIPLLKELPEPLGMGPSSGKRLKKLIDYMGVPVYVQPNGPYANQAVVKFSDLCSRLAKRVYVEQAGRQGITEEELSKADRELLVGAAGSMQMEALKTSLKKSCTWSEHVAAVALQQIIRSYKARKALEAKAIASGKPLTSRRFSSNSPTRKASSTLTLVQRVANLEVAVFGESQGTGPIVKKVGALEETVLGDKQSGPISNRVSTLETYMHG